MHCIGIAMLLYRPNFTVRRLGATLLVCERILGLVLVGQGSRNPDEVAALAYPDFEEIAAVIIQCHIDRVPSDNNLIPLAFSLNIGRWSV